MLQNNIDGLHQLRTKFSDLLENTEATVNYFVFNMNSNR